MMRSLFSAALVAAAVAGPLAGQVPATDTASSRLVLQIEQNFRARAKEELGLTDEQSDRVVAVMVRVANRRRAIGAEHQRLNEVLAGELRPGIAADPGVVTRTLDSLGALQVAQARVFGEEQHELAGFLTPVQRGQFYQLQARLWGRVSEIREDRQRMMERRRGRFERP